MLIAKEEFKKLSKITPIHLGYTESKMPSEMNSGILKKDVKIEGDYVEHMPDFFYTIKEFDLIQRSKIKSYRNLIQFLQNKLLKKLLRNEKDFTTLNRKRLELKKLRTKVLNSWSKEQDLYRNFLFIFKKNAEGEDQRR